MALVFALGRLAGSVLRLGGRYRLARWVGLCIAVFGVILVVGTRADASTGRGTERSAYLHGGSGDAVSVIFGTFFTLGLVFTVWLALGIALLAISTGILCIWDRMHPETPCQTVELSTEQYAAILAALGVLVFMAAVQTVLMFSAKGD